MIYKKRESMGNFLKKGVDFKENDMIEIASEGKQIEGQYGMQDVFLIKTSKGVEGNANFNQTTINNLIDAFGEDSVKWIGKKVRVWGILSNVQGKMRKVYYFLHPDTELNEETGQFLVKQKNKKKDKSGETEEDIPIIEEGEDEINIDEIVK